MFTCFRARQANYADPNREDIARRQLTGPRPESHDLGVVQYMCDDIAVMYLGQIVERADCRQLFAEPLHRNTGALLAAVPSPERRAGVKSVVSGDPPSPIDPPAGCRFHPRCPLAQDRCRAEAPDLRSIPGGREVACHLVS